MKLRSFSIESCVLYVVKVKVMMMVVIIQMSLLEEKTPSKQFVMPKVLLPPTCHAMLFLHTQSFSSHIHHLTPSPHTLQVGSMVVYLCSEDARQVTGSTLTIDGGWTTR